MENRRTNTTSTVYLCNTCQHPVTWDEKSVMCDTCETWYHLECQGINSAEYSMLGHDSVTWVCSICNTRHESLASPAILHMESCSTPHHHTINSDSTNLSSISIDSLDENRRTLGTSSSTKYKPSTAKGRPLRIINVNCQSITG